MQTDTVALPKFRPFGALTIADLFVIVALAPTAVYLTPLLTKDPQLVILLSIVAFGLAAMAARFLVFVTRGYVSSLIADGPRLKLLLFVAFTGLVVALSLVQVLVKQAVPLAKTPAAPSHTDTWSTAPARTGDTRPLAEAADAVNVALLDLDSRTPARKFDRIDERAAYQAWIAEMAKRLGDRIAIAARGCGCPCEPASCPRK